LRAGASGGVGRRISGRAVDRARRQPGYYSRFGFEYAVPLGITIKLPEWAPPEAAQVLRLNRYDAGVGGEVEYPPAFNTTGE
jgi:predicted N-acetyltransferase YhbS